MRKFTKYPQGYVKASSVDTVDQAMKLLDELYAQFEYMLETYGDTPPTHKVILGMIMLSIINPVLLSRC